MRGHNCTYCGGLAVFRVYATKGSRIRRTIACIACASGRMRDWIDSADSMSLSVKRIAPRVPKETTHI